jgi:hypothetical protein
MIEAIMYESETGASPTCQCLKKKEAVERLGRVFYLWLTIMALSELAFLAIANAVNIYKTNPDCYLLLCFLLPCSMCASWIAGIEFGKAASSPPITTPS